MAVGTSSTVGSEVDVAACCVSYSRDDIPSIVSLWRRGTSACCRATLALIVVMSSPVGCVACAPLVVLEGSQSQLADNEMALQAACGSGQLDVVRELLALGGDREVNVHAGGEAAFRGACLNGQLDVVRELLALGGDREVDVSASCCLDCTVRYAYPSDHRIVLLIVSMRPSLPSDLVVQLACHWLSAVHVEDGAVTPASLMWRHW